MVYTGIGSVPEGQLDLEISAGGGYEAKNPARNGMRGAFGMINVKTCTSAEFTFTFKVGGSPHEMKEFEITFLDLDAGNPARMWEAVKAEGFDEMTEAGTPLYSTELSGSEATIRATHRGVGADNPSD